MNPHQEIYVKESIIENNIPLRNIEYNEIKNNGHPVYIQGHVNDKTFSYIHPILRKDTYEKSSNGKLHNKRKHNKKKTVRFRRKLSSTENVGMPMLLPSRQEKVTSKKKRKSTRKSKKSSTSNKLKKNTIVHE